MKWFEVTVVTSREFADVVSITLIDMGSEGTVIRDSADLKDLLSSGIIWDYVDEHLLASSDPRVFVSGFFPSDFNIHPVIKSLQALSSASEIEVGAFEISFKEIDSNDWENEWKKYYTPIEFSSFAIVPEWIKKHGILNKKIILLSPGMAFGTGTHETTSMCLKLMDELDFGGKNVIDLGTGSGILGITAASLGALNTLLTDIDSSAVKCAYDNAILNGLQDSLVVLKADLFTEDLLKRMNELDGEKAKALLSIIENKADILTANLTAPLLLLAKEGIKSNLAKDGTLIISGILKDYNKEVLDSYLLDFEIMRTLKAGDWVAHQLKRRQ